MDALIGLCVAGVIGLVTFLVSRSPADGPKVKDAALLRQDATIVDIRVVHPNRKVDYLRTEVVFSDGFTYVSHQTEKKSTLAGIKLTVTPEMKMEIMQAAVKAHEEALYKRS